MTPKCATHITLHVLLISDDMLASIKTLTKFRGCTCDFKFPMLKLVYSVLSITGYLVSVLIFKVLFMNCHRNTKK